MPRHFLDISDFERTTLEAIIENARRLKAAQGVRGTSLAGRTLAMIFENPSTRTRLSFDVAMRGLGGDTIVLTSSDMQLGRGESVADTARVMSRYVDAIMIRTPDSATLTELAAFADIPVINGLTRASHPCQIMADLMTLVEHRGELSGARVVWIGAANNVLTSWIHAATKFDFTLVVATPENYAPDSVLIDAARLASADIELIKSAKNAASRADCVITDTWISMGDDDNDERRESLKSYQVTAAIMAETKPTAIFMHCLPAHRGEEVEAAVIDGPKSVVWDEAENRMHAQKAILAWCLEVVE